MFEVICENCEKHIPIDEAKWPKREFHIPCPECRHTVRFDTRNPDGAPSTPGPPSTLVAEMLPRADIVGAAMEARDKGDLAELLDLALMVLLDLREHNEQILRILRRQFPP